MRQKCYYILHQIICLYFLTIASSVIEMVEILSFIYKCAPAEYYKRCVFFFFFLVFVISFPLILLWPTFFRCVFDI